MTNFVEIIKACEQATGNGSKKIIAGELAKADFTAQRLIMETQNPYRVFGVRKFSMPDVYSDTDPSDYGPVFDILDKLHARMLTGDAARDAVTRMLGWFTADSATYMERVLDKDLKIGASRDTVNKIFPGLVPTFEVMLADKCETTEDFEKEVTFPCQADHKLDGERTIAIVKKGSVVYYSRSGKEATHVNGLFDEELQNIRDYLCYDFVIDGERYASNFTETMNAKKSGNDEAKQNLRLHAFFLMPLMDWLNQKTQITMRANRAALESILKETACQKIVLTKGREVRDYSDMMEYCNEVIDGDKVEGLILKDWNSPYIWDRKFAWTKVKRFYDADCRVVGFYCGKPKSRLENTLGGMNVVGFLEDGTRVETCVGSGFSDALRDEIWGNQEDWLGTTVVIKYQEVSRSKSKEIASLRFPTFERQRDDKIVEI